MVTEAEDLYPDRLALLINLYELSIDQNAIPHLSVILLLVTA